VSDLKERPSAPKPSTPEPIRPGESPFERDWRVIGNDGWKAVRRFEEEHPGVDVATPVRPPATLQHEIRHVAFSGPLPPPGLMKAYNDILPGSADRITKMWEGEVQHRQASEREESAFKRDEAKCQSDHARRMEQSRHTTSSGFILVLLVAAVALIASGNKVEGYSSAGGSLVAAIVKAYLERNEKKQESAAPPPPPTPKKAKKKRK
jgi:uncharacterized membrane protein